MFCGDFIMRDPEFLSKVQWLPKEPKKRQEAIDDHFISNRNGGLNLCSRYIRCRGMREGGIRLSRGDLDSDGPTALEILAFGVGVFREKKTEQDSTYAKVMGEAPLSKVDSFYVRVFPSFVNLIFILFSFHSAHTKSTLRRMIVERANQHAQSLYFSSQELQFQIFLLESL